MNVTAALRALNLPVMAEALDVQEAAGDLRTFLERLEALVAAQVGARHSGALDRRVKRATLPQPTAALEDVRYSGRSLSRDAVKALAKGAWVDRGEHVLITGPSGSGKTWLACALASNALRQGHEVRWFHVADFLVEWHAAVEAGTLRKFQRSLQRAAVVVLDDWGVEPLYPEDVLALRRLVCGRERVSLVLASPFPESAWDAWLGGEYVAESMLRRLKNGAHRLAL